MIIGFQFINSYFFQSSNLSSYATLKSGTALLNNTDLEQNKEYELESWDMIQTWDQGLVIIAWWDGSLTRVWENSQLEIRVNDIAKNKSHISIAFHLFSWKTWSNVVSYISDTSSFTQSFDDIEAGVRGTVFDVDLSNNFLRVTDHEVVLRDQAGKIVSVQEWDILSIESFNLISIQDFLEAFEDIDWTKLNENEDIIYLTTLRDALESEIGKRNPFLFILEYFSPKYRLLYELDTAEDYETVQAQLEKVKLKNYEKIYTAVLEKYQKYNFVSSSQFEFYKRKVFYKRALVYLAPNDNEKQELLRTSLYDLQHILEVWWETGMKETLEFIQENKEILPEIDLSFLEAWFELIPEGLREAFGDNLSEITELIPNFQETNFQDIGSAGKEVLENVDDGIKGFLDENVGGLIDSFKK